MAPIRSDAATAAAPAMTRSGRVKKVSQAALRAISSENHEVQQARRSGLTKQRAGTNRQGQSLASGTPMVVISSQNMRPASMRDSTPVNATMSQQHPATRSTATPLHITALQNSTSAATSAILAATQRSDSLDLFYRTAAAQPRSRTATSVIETRSSGPIATDTEDEMDLEPLPSLRPVELSRADGNQAADDFPASNDEGMGTGAARTRHGDEVDDWDEGASDEFVPSDVGEDEDDEEYGDDDDEGDDPRIRDDEGGDTRIRDDEGDGRIEDEHADKADSGVKDVSVSSGNKSRARRNSRRTKKSQPKASDYSEDVEALLNHGLGYMRAMVVAEKPMPSVDESIELATDAFELAKHDRPTVHTPDNVKYISILRRAIPQVRGRIKDAARARTGDSYGFDDRPRMEQKNRRRYLALIEQDAYTYEKPDSLEGPYYHPLCYKILKTCFFSKAGDDGVAFNDFFAPIRPETIALVFTAIRMCLDEWKSGSFKALHFTSEIYESVYQVHLANLKALEEVDPLFAQGLGEELWEDCSEPFDLEKKSKPSVSISAAQKMSGVLYAQERRNARTARKASAAAAAAAAAATATGI